MTIQNGATQTWSYKILTMLRLLFLLFLLPQFLHLKISCIELPVLLFSICPEFPNSEHLIFFFQMCFCYPIVNTVLLNLCVNWCVTLYDTLSVVLVHKFST